MKGKVLAVLHDPGSAAMLLPVLERLVAGGGLALYGSEFTCPYFSRHGLPAKKIPSDLSEPEARQLLLETAPFVLLTGTSWNSSAESRLRSVAGKVRSVAVVDYWANYAERFPEGFLSEIFVLDKGMEGELRRLGASKVSVTGHPQLEMLSREKSPAVKPVNRVLFLSEPRNTPPFGPGHPLALLSDSLPHATIEFKRHPKEREAPDSRITSLKNVKIVSRDLALPEEFASYSLVAGYQSMGLFQAAALGCPAVAFPSFDLGPDLERAMEDFGIAKGDISRALQKQARASHYTGATQKILSLLEGKEA